MERHDLSASAQSYQYYTHILYTETLSADLSQVLSIIAPGVEADAMLKKFRINESLPIDWQAYYDEEIAKRVAQFYKEDFKQYGYSLDSWRKTTVSDNNAVETQYRLEQKPLELESRALKAICSRNDVINKLIVSKVRASNASTDSVDMPNLSAITYATINIKQNREL